MKRTLLLITLIMLVVACGVQQPEAVGSVSQPLSFIQSRGASNVTSASSVALAFTSNELAGDLNVVFVGWNNTTAHINTLTDSRGNAYVLAAGPTANGSNATQAAYYAKNVIAGSNTVTVTFSATVPWPDLRILEYAGLDTVNPFDVAASAVGTSTSPSSGNATTTAANDLLVASDYVADATTADGAGYTERLKTVPYSDIVEDKTAGAAGTYSATCTTTTGWWIMQLLAFKVPTVVDAGQDATQDVSEGGSDGGMGDSSVGQDSVEGADATAEPETGSVEAGGVDSSGSGDSPLEANDEADSESDTSDGGTGNDSGATCGPNGPFPLTYSADSRTLVGADGIPFPILGRTLWSLIGLSPTDQRSTIDDTISRGFNAFEWGAIWAHPLGVNTPLDGAGDPPFLLTLSGAAWNGNLSQTPDFATPNPAFWQEVDDILSYAEARGVLALTFPAYEGFGGGNQGWMTQMVANGPTKMQAYGAWVVTRLSAHKNIVWMAGGDQGTFNQAQHDVEAALLTGMKSVAPNGFYSAEWDTETTARENSSFGNQMNLDAAYSFQGNTASVGLRAYGHSPTNPAFLLEEPYDQAGPDGDGANGFATQPVRRFQWWGWLSTIGGYVAGNEFVWAMADSAWKDHLSSQGARDMSVLNQFIRSRLWYQLVPSGQAGMKTIVTSGGTGVSAAATPTGTLAVAYVPPGHAGSITVDMTVMSTPAKARWLDPTLGSYTTIAGSPFTNTGTHSFTPPGGTHADGASDWTLVLETP